MDGERRILPLMDLTAMCRPTQLCVQHWGAIYIRSAPLVHGARFGGLDHMKRFVLVVAVAAFSSSAFAGDLYNNGAPDYTNGNEMTQWTQAADFTGVNATIGSVTFTFIDLLNSNLGQWDGTIDWYIYNDAGGQPGGIAASGVGSNFVTSLDGNFGGWDNYTMTFDLGGGGFAANGANTYWLGLNLNQGWDRDELYWTTTGANGTFGDAESNGTPDGPWNINGLEHAFALHEIPAPGALALLGIAGLAVRRRRRS